MQTRFHITFVFAFVLVFLISSIAIRRIYSLTILKAFKNHIFTALFIIKTNVKNGTLNAPTWTHPRNLRIIVESGTLYQPRRFEHRQSNISILGWRFKYFPNVYLFCYNGPTREILKSLEFNENLHRYKYSAGPA